MRRGQTIAAIARWILFLPTGLTVAFGLAAFGAVAAIRAPEELTEAIITFWDALGSLAAVYLGSRIAPSRRRGAAVAVAVVLVGFLMLLQFEASDLGRWALAILAGVFLAFRRAAADPSPRSVGADPELTGRRYKGMTPFQDLALDRKTFFGRDRESRSLLSLVLAERLVVVFAKSGMGKTSLLNAGLVEPLRGQGYFPMAVRLADVERGPVASVFEGIRRAAREARVDCVGGDESSLWHFFKSAEFWSEDDNLLRPVLIVDQFEELFTLHTPERRRQLISALAELVRGRVDRGKPSGEERSAGAAPDLKIVLSLREDFLADLEELARDIPAILHHRFRLGPLTRDGARAAVIEPARLEEEAFDTAPFAYREAAVEQILGFLARRRHGAETVAGDDVEPAQLQLICQYLEEKVRARETGGGELRISEADVGGDRHMQRVLESFYDRTLRAVWPPRQARRVRRLCEKGLIITGSRRRRTEDEEVVERKYKVSKELLQQLVDARLLRSEPRLGGAFYELSHDTLVEPILQSRKKRVARWRWLSASAAAAVILSTAGWVATGQREFSRKQEAEVSERLVKSGTDPKDLAKAKLDEIEAGYSGWVRSRQMVGAMTFALVDVARHFPELRQRADGIGDDIRASFNQKHGVKVPELSPADWADIPPGRFQMGSPESEVGRDADERLYWVELSTFRMLKHEVTNAEYRRFDPSHRGRNELPAVGINWYEAFAYAAWVGGRLPTEAEWEYAARAGTKTRHWSGDEWGDLASVGWFVHHSGGKLQPVRQLRANDWGLYDVHGNAWEWVVDWYGPYPTGPQTDPWGPPSGEKRVIRGGSFFDLAQDARAANRKSVDPVYRNVNLGFRVVLPGAPSD